MPFLAQPRDVLEHDDRIVDDHARGECQAAQRHHVEAQIGLAHEEERGDQRDRQRQRNDEGAAAMAEEEEDHQDRQRAADQGVVADVVERVLDEHRLVVDGGQARARRQGRLEFFEGLVDGVGHGHGIAVAFLVHRQFDGLVRVDADDAFAFLVALAHIGDVLEPDRHAVLDLDQHLAHLVEVGELVDRAHEVTLAAFLDAPGRDIDVLVAQAVDDVADAEVQLGQLLLVQGYVDLVFEAAADLDRGDAGDWFETLLQFVVGEAAQLLEFCLARTGSGARTAESEPDDRIGGRVEAQQDRLLRLQRQAQDVELVARFEAGLLHVRAPGELEDHVGLAGARDRVDLAHVLDHAERFLDRLRDQVLDLDRRRALVLGAHGQGRIGQIRQQVDLEPGQRD